jgi:hypothetical protein
MPGTESATRMKTWLVVLYLGKSVAVAASFGACVLRKQKTATGSGR